MSWNGTGTYVLNPAYTPEAPGNVVDSTRYNGALTDIANGITASLAKNGENVPTANLGMGGFKHTNAAAGSAAGEYVEYAQFIAATFPLVVESGATVAILANTHHALTNAGVTTATAPGAPAVGTRFRVSVCNSRTDNVINWNSLKHEGLSDATTTLNISNTSTEWVYINATFGWKLQ